MIRNEIQELVERKIVSINWLKQDQSGECLGVSQITSLAQLAVEDTEGALETQKQCLGTVNNVANGIPLVSYTKGVIHHMLGDHEGRNEALNAVTRSTVVVASGTTAALASGGPCTYIHRFYLAIL